MRRGAVLTTCAVAFGLAGCSSARPAASGARVVVVEHDYGITLSPSSVRAGLVTLHVENNGPSTHELLIDKSVLEPEALPLRVNTVQIEEGSPALTKVASLVEIRLNSTHDMTIRLTPGHYVLFCNLEGHYLGGMHVSLQVKE